MLNNMYTHRHNMIICIITICIIIGIVISII